MAASGYFKLIQPYQNFAVTIEVYDLLNPSTTQLVAQVLPWIEVFTGVFLIAGIWIKLSLISAWLMFLTFIAVVGQALVRKIPIHSCGCFGDGIHLSPWMVLAVDSLVWVVLTIGIRNPQLVSRLSLEKSNER